MRIEQWSANILPPFVLVEPNTRYIINYYAAWFRFEVVFSLQYVLTAKFYKHTYSRKQYVLLFVYTTYCRA